MTWPWIKLDIRATQRARLTHTETVVLAALAANSTEEALAAISYRTLAQYTQLSRRHVIRCVAGLEEALFLERLEPDSHTDTLTVRILAGAAAGAAPVRLPQAYPRRGIDAADARLFDPTRPEE